MSAPDLREDRFGVLTAPATLTLRRRLPGPIERVWAYLTDTELRRQWLASGGMALQPGASFEFVWRNDELSASSVERPEGFSEESRATCQITEVEPLRKLRFTWPGVGDVTFQLDWVGEDVMLTITHRRLPDGAMTLLVGAGWHMHLDILAARVNGNKPASFWSGWLRLRSEYESRFAACKNDSSIQCEN
jgi:uncharacterized protein YndB with AHSA1/START domain